MLCELLRKDLKLITILLEVILSSQNSPKSRIYQRVQNCFFNFVFAPKRHILFVSSVWDLKHISLMQLLPTKRCCFTNIMAARWCLGFNMLLHLLTRILSPLSPWVCRSGAQLDLSGFLLHRHQTHHHNTARKERAVTIKKYKITLISLSDINRSSKVLWKSKRA